MFTITTNLKNIKTAIFQYKKVTSHETLSVITKNRLAFFEWMIEHCNDKYAADKVLYAKMLLVKIHAIFSDDNSWDSRLIQYM